MNSKLSVMQEDLSKGTPGISWDAMPNDQPPNHIRFSLKSNHNSQIRETVTKSRLSNGRSGWRSGWSATPSRINMYNRYSGRASHALSESSRSSRSHECAPCAPSQGRQEAAQRPRQVCSHGGKRVILVQSKVKKKKRVLKAPSVFNLRYR